MDNQHLFNLLFSGLGFCGAWIINNIWSLLRSQQQQLTALNVELAKNYMPRMEMQDTVKQLFTAIDGIHKELSHIVKNQAQLKALQDAIQQIQHLRGDAK